MTSNLFSAHNNKVYEIIKSVRKKSVGQGQTCNQANQLNLVYNSAIYI